MQIDIYEVFISKTTTDNNEPLEGTGWSPKNKIPFFSEVLFF